MISKIQLNLDMRSGLQRGFSQATLARMTYPIEEMLIPNAIEQAMGLFETLRHRNRCVLLKAYKALPSALPARTAFRSDLKGPDRRPAKGWRWAAGRRGNSSDGIGPLASPMTMSSGGDLKGGRCQRKRGKTPSPG
jgi:hypothetical protein